MKSRIGDKSPGIAAPAAAACDLCGLPVRTDIHSAVFGDRTLWFCCAGCRMVYAMLMEASDSPDPATFRQSDVYRRCLAAGIVPAGEDEAPPSGPDPAAAVDSPIPTGMRGEGLTLRRNISGMWCPACAWVVQTALEKVDGVTEARCDFCMDSLMCRYDPSRVAPEQISRAVARLGYKLLDGDAEGPEHDGAFVRLMICAILTMNIMMLSWALYTGFFTDLSPEGIAFISLPIGVMSTFVLLYAGGPIARKAWHGLRAGAPGMESLILLGSGSAYLYSLYSLFNRSLHLYFDTAAMLITLLLLGKLLETRAKRNVQQDLKGLLALQPAKVRLCSPRFPQGRYTASAQLAVGDLFRVGAGEIVPADGLIVDGAAQVDTSAITGESRPVKVGQGDTLISGSRLIDGDVRVRAQRIGAEALLGQMITIVQRSLEQKIPLEDRTDRLLAWLVPFMALLALGTALATWGLGLSPDQALIRGVTVLVIVCPCALGIAIPLARVAGLSGAARRGFLVRDFEVFERMPQIDTVVFDKTGTVTQGQWRLEGIESVGLLQRDDILRLAAGLEKDADHAVARAVMDFAMQKRIEPLSVSSVVHHPQGVEGCFEGSHVRIGSWPFVREAFGRSEPEPTARDGSPAVFSRVYMTIDGKLCAILEFGDRPRPAMADLFGVLRHRGLHLHLISGDAPDTTAKVARALGIEDYAGLLDPTQKADYIAGLRAAGAVVAMVGDGINDAPALARADLGIAIHTGRAALAGQVAQVTIMRGDPAQLPDLIDWARRVHLKVRQNLGCALIYNLIGIPLAMGGWLSPLVAVTAMLLSSLTVIGNTLLLIRYPSAQLSHQGFTPAAANCALQEPDGGQNKRRAVR